MKKTILAGGAALLTLGFFTLTAFGGGKTKAQQEAEIAQAVTTKVEALRAEKAQECDTRIAEAAKMKYNEMLAAMPAEPAKPGTKTPKGKTPSAKPAPAPLPQPTPPNKPTTKVDEKVNSRLPTGSPTQQKPDEKKVDEKVKSRLPQKPAGGGQ